MTEWQALVAPHARVLYPGDGSFVAVDADAPPDSVFGHRYPFSACVPLLLSTSKTAIAMYSDYAGTWPEFAEQLVNLVERLLRDEFRGAINLAVPVSQRSLIQATQLVADIRVLQDGIGEIERCIYDRLCPGEDPAAFLENAPLASVRGVFASISTENEDLVMQLIDKDLQELVKDFALTNAWQSTGAGTSRQTISGQIEAVADFFRNSLSMMQGVLEPALVEGAFFAAFNALNSHITDAFTAPTTKSISAAAVAALADGLCVSQTKYFAF